MHCDDSFYQEAGPTKKEQFRIFFFIFNGIILSINIPIVILLSKKLYKESKEYVVNIFKIIQISSFLLGRVMIVVITPITMIWHQYTLAALFFGQLVLIHIIIFQISNLM